MGELQLKQIAICNMGGHYPTSWRSEQNKKTSLLKQERTSPADSSALLALLGLHLLARKLELHHQLSWVLSLPAHSAGFGLVGSTITWDNSLQYYKVSSNTCISLSLSLSLSHTHTHTHTHTHSRFLWRTLTPTLLGTESNSRGRDLKDEFCALPLEFLELAL